jgi:hypothetical protein
MDICDSQATAMASKLLEMKISLSVQKLIEKYKKSILSTSVLCGLRNVILKLNISRRE